MLPMGVRGTKGVPLSAALSRALSSPSSSPGLSTSMVSSCCPSWLCPGASVWSC